ncbi:MAG: ABC transporter ATP-binding protein, partial [Planctomycetota bacterium]
LRCLAGLEQLERGRIRFLGRTMTDGSSVLPPDQRGLGFVFQDSALWPHLSARRQLRFADPGLARGDQLRLLAQVGLEDVAEQKPGELSGGERKRLALARALVGQPKILMLDEPLHSVDVPLRDELGLLIRRIADERGLALIVVTHDRDEALAMADELLILGDGRIVESGKAASLLANPRTAYAARFLCRAACFPAKPGSGGTLATPFGAWPRPAVANGAMSLVVLPGDLGVARAPTERTPLGRVLSVLPVAGQAVASVELSGQMIEVGCDASTHAGDTLALELLGEPRFLSDEEGGARS